MSEGRLPTNLLSTFLSPEGRLVSTGNGHDPHPFGHDEVDEAVQVWRRLVREQVKIVGLLAIATVGLLILVEWLTADHDLLFRARVKSMDPTGGLSVGSAMTAVSGC